MAKYRIEEPRRGTVSFGVALQKRGSEWFRTAKAMYCGVEISYGEVSKSMET